MRNRFTAGLSGMALVLAAGCAAAPRSPAAVPGSDAGVVHVAPPTGEREADRASILAAVEQVQPGGTIQFAPGMYLVGDLVPVPTPRITLLGHPEGTLLRGCDPADFVDMDVALFTCNGFQLTGGHQTVRNLIFEYAWHGLHVGCCFPENLDALEAGEAPRRSQIGGNLIEGNTFQYSSNGIRVIGESFEPTVIRENRFVDVYHAVGINGRTVHFLDNDISVHEPERVPISGHPGNAIGITPFDESRDHTSCAGNVIAGNQIAGHPGAIHILVVGPGTSCRDNVIRDNTIVVSRVPFASAWIGIQLRHEADSTVVGVPIGLLNLVEADPETFGRGDEPGEEALLEDNLVEGNRVIGAEGLGIELLHGSRNRIINNTITGVLRRDPFPGNTLGFLPEWHDANGSGIWVSPASDGNEIVGNTFEDIAASAVVIDGDRNRVELQGADDEVRDLGTGNRVERAAGVPRESSALVRQAPQSATPQEWADPSPHEIRYVTVASGVQLEVLDWGGGGDALVFLAGLSMNAHAFDGFAPRFTDTHRVVGITRRGHGASSWPDDGYSLEGLVEDIRVVLDTLGLERVVFAAHSLAGEEITRFASEYSDRVAGLVYIDAAHDPTLIERLRIMDLCPMGPEILGAIERRFENPEAFRRTQLHVAPDGTSKPFVSDTAVAQLIAGSSTPDYSAVRAPALAVYHTPRWVEDVFGGEVTFSQACIAANQRYIYEGIAGFAVGMEKGRIVALEDSQHNIHLVSPDALEAVMRRWLADLPKEQ